MAWPEMFMKSLAWMLPAGMAMQGCSSSFTVVSDTTADSAQSIRLDQLNRRLQGHDVRLFLVDGRHIDGMSVSVGYDTIRFREGTDDTLHCIPTRLIIEIEQTDRLRGTIEGVAFGGLIGGAAGLGLIGAVVHPEGEGGPGLLWVVLGGACAGATTGIVAGMIKGHTITYRLGTPMPSTQKAALGARLTEIPGSLDSPPFHREFVNVQE